MNDETYTLVQTNKERKTLARNAKYRKIGSRTKYVSLPSDTLTAAERRRLNGAVMTYDMNAPHAYCELKYWPDDIAREYLLKIINEYHPTSKALDDMLACSHATTWRFMKNLGIQHSNRKHADLNDVLRFDDFCDPSPVRPVIAEPDPIPETPTIAPPIRKPITYDSISLSFTGTADDLITLIQTGPLHITGADTYEFSITATRKGA